jgi:hypothetical protein
VGLKGFSRPEHYDIYRDLLYEIVAKQRPMTVRQVFYRAVVKGYVEKTEKGYSYVQRDLADLAATAQDLERKNRPAEIFHFGDYDPSGQDAIATVQRDLPELAPQTARLGIEFEIVAVTPEQIEEMNLPTRPTKTSDTRASSFGSNLSVELDAIEPNVLRQMVDETLQACFPPGALDANRRQQEKDRQKIRRQIRRLLAKR